MLNGCSEDGPNPDDIENFECTDDNINGSKCMLNCAPGYEVNDVNSGYVYECLNGVWTPFQETRKNTCCLRK